MGPEAAALLDALVARVTVRGESLLCASNDRCMVETTPGKRAAAIAAAMAGAPFDLRDIRRTCETLLASLGISTDTRAQLLPHGLTGVQSVHYDRHTYAQEKRAALVAWEAFLLRTDSSRVVNFSR
ncbi:hypothetical protein [Immundisolibacter sp.]|uniref:hypothetical protein n=1 Tax=Immundisolibacter sp. TaxID=1934948 RepID=UPI003561A0DA